MARIIHDQFSYELSPGTAIKDFKNMNKVTSVEAGNLYVYLFEEEHYQGRHQVVRPGEKALVSGCGSAVFSNDSISVDAIKTQKCPPARFWELSGSRYVLHFSPIYRYVS
ncbi:MAG: hypothetical protein AB1815_11605 [Bacillota bacterium]